MFPRLIALDTDGTIFAGKLDQAVWGKGQNAEPKLADNVYQVNDSTLRDRSNPVNEIRLSPDIPRIITDILQSGAVLAIVSRNTSRALCDRALYYFKTKDPKSEETKSIIHLVKYDEVVDEPISEHLKRIKGWSHFQYSDMVVFGAVTNVQLIQKELGVSGHASDPATGLTWERYSAGLDAWRRGKEPKPIGSTTLGIAHFNDVYQVTDQTIFVDGKKETINVMKFATLLSDVMAKWKNEGLTIFSGDLFSPSTESSITRGRHMPAIVNELNIDVSVVGNHEFDFAFPWLLSNIIDTNTNAVPEPMKDIHVLTKEGIRIGFIGLVEKDWIATITGWPDNFQFQDMAKVGRELSTKLRDPAGPYKCDFVIALTHCRIPNDIKLARDLGALSPSAQNTTNIANTQGVDILLGGHDHVYWISKGVTAWEGYDLKASPPDAKDDNGDVLIVKSGTDYQDISEVILTVQDTPPGSVRKKVVQEIRGKRWITRGNIVEHKVVGDVFNEELSIVSSAMDEQLCITSVELDTRSKHIRLQESAVGNWVADCLRNAYDEALRKLGYDHGTDGVIICNGDIRGDRLYDKGPLYLRDLMTMLPYPDPLLVVELSAQALWDALESGLSRYPVQEGRFPAVSGLRVEWDSSKPAGKRVVSLSLLSESKLDSKGNPTLEKVDPTSTTRKYLVMVGEYMAQGGDGYDILKTQKQVLTAENGQSKSALVRKYLLGTQVLNQKVKENPQPKPESAPTGRFASALRSIPSLPSPTINPVAALSSFTAQSVRSIRGTADEQRRGLQQVDAIQKLSQKALDNVTPSVKWLASQRLVSAALQLAEFEDVGLMDPYERLRTRREAQRDQPNVTARFAGASRTMATASIADGNNVNDAVNSAEKKAAETLPVIYPVVDGRLKDLSRSK
ncbi:hypothetical protein ONZ45_g11924 [Pleurotus djamor]|nr:hypothetical protein ONZ45_g11924 [Pleurotus djamor]